MMRSASPQLSPDLDEAAALLNDLESLWPEATPDERRRLISPLIERVYVDVDSRRVGGLKVTQVSIN